MYTRRCNLFVRLLNRLYFQSYSLFIDWNEFDIPLIVWTKSVFIYRYFHLFFFFFSCENVLAGTWSIHFWRNCSLIFCLVLGRNIGAWFNSFKNKYIEINFPNFSFFFFFFFFEWFVQRITATSTATGQIDGRGFVKMYSFWTLY